MSETRSYNLLCQPWIPVVWRKDAAEPKPPKVGISETLERAHAICCISHTAPFIEFGLYRLLITIVLDAYIVADKRPTIGRMRLMLEGERFDACVIDRYLSVHKVGFDLWGDGQRFFQRESADGKKPEALVRMFAAIPSGTNVAHWNHFTEHETSVAEEVAAQFLAAVAPWNFKTKPGEARTLAGDPPMYALVMGESVFQTVVLNLPRPSGRVTFAHEQANGPVWRREEGKAHALDDLAKLPKTPTLAEGFTWPSRVIRLDGDGRVAKAVNYAAYKKPTDKAKKKGGNLYGAKSAWRDPNAGTVTNGKSIEHIKACHGVPVWRDAIPLFLIASEGEALRGQKRRSRPEVITNALRVLDMPRVLDLPRFRVAVYGMRKKSGGGGDVKVEEWFRSVLTLPAEVARDSRLSHQAIDAFNTAQRVADALKAALRMLRPKMAAVPRERKRLRETQRGEGDALATFWQALEPVLARSYLADLAAQKPEARSSLDNWLGMEARNAFANAAAAHRRNADGLFRIANAGNYLERRLRGLLPKEKNL